MSYLHSILIVEHDYNHIHKLAKVLNESGYKTLYADSEMDGLSIAAAIHPDLLIINSEITDVEFFIRKIRKWSSIPIIVLSQKENAYAKVNALDIGADDYITIPYNNNELLARIRTALRHNYASMISNKYIHKNLTIWFDKSIVTIDNKPIHMTQVQYRILSYLAKNNGAIVTYNQLMQYVWGPHNDGNNRILRVNITNIRKKIEQNTSNPIHLITETGIGYRMNASEK